MAMRNPPQRTAILLGRLLHRSAPFIFTAWVACTSLRADQRAGAADKPSVPNIVLILADDKYDDLAGNETNSPGIAAENAKNRPRIDPLQPRRITGN
jgi:hypothetical protein